MLEAATEHAIESGAEDVELLEDNVLEFTCGKTNMRAVQNNLEKLNYNINSASVEYIPYKLQVLNEDELTLCAKLYEKLEAIPEVVNLTDNIA